MTTLPSSSPPARSFGLSAGLVAVLVTGVSWQILSRAAASLLTTAEKPAMALVLRPTDSRSLTDLSAIMTGARPAENEAGENLKVAAASAAGRIADAALSAGPLNTNALRLRAQAMETLGDKPKSEALMKLAGAQTIRDGVVDLYLLALYAGRKDYAQAMHYADALLRLSPKLAPDVYPILIQMALQPDAQKALTDALEVGPPWRPAFLAELGAKVQDPDGQLDLLLALKAASSPPKGRELRTYLDALIARGLVTQAYYTWLQFLPAKRLANITYLYNGNFEYALTDTPFDWTILPIEGAEVTVARVPDKDQYALSVQFDGRRVPFRNVVQMLVLPPGKYTFEGSYTSNDLNNQRGLTWRLYCAQRNDSVPVAQTDRVSGNSNGWQSFKAEFEVPADRCGAQWLRLELAARVSLEEAVSGSVRYTGLSVRKSDGEVARPTMPAITMPAQPGSKFERAVRSR